MTEYGVSCRLFVSLENRFIFIAKPKTPPGKGGQGFSFPHITQTLLLHYPKHFVLSIRGHHLNGVKAAFAFRLYLVVTCLLAYLTADHTPQIGAPLWV